MGKIDNGYIHILHESQTYEYAKKGYFDDLEVDGFKMKVYNIWLQTLLFWGSISEVEKFKNIQIDSEKYKHFYMNGYKKGQEYFIKYYKDNPNNSSVKSLIHKILDKNKEVAKVLNTNEYILNEEVIEKYGYNSGMYLEMQKFEKENIYDFDEVSKLMKNGSNRHLSEKEKKDVELPYYVNVGVLFAQNLIKKKKYSDGFRFEYYFKDKKFSSISSLSKYIKNEILKTEKSVKQYINDTLQESGTKNFYDSFLMKENIIKHCDINGIKILNPKFIDKSKN